MFVSVAVCFNISYGCGMRFCALDAAFSKHIIYCDGHLHLLTTRDGNNKVIVLVWALCETESGPTYKWFADQWLSHYRPRPIPGPEHRDIHRPYEGYLT